MSENIQQKAESAKDRGWPTVSAVLTDGSLVETLLLSEESRTLFCVAAEGAWRRVDDLLVNGDRLVPYSPQNNLLRHEAVLLPSEPHEYDSEEKLLGEIQSFIHRYVDLSPAFEKVATYYVLLSWVYDRFQELPYLRVRGDYGSGKTRFLLTVGSLCYKPIFASGASTVSPLFRILDAFRGTLVIDEGDFRFSDEKAEIVKILNNGNAKGFPVLRTEVSGGREFNPRAYHVFGPKLVATRGYFEDPALESRCLTEEMGLNSLREDIPISLPSTFGKESLELRNKLLVFRFRNFHKRPVEADLVDRAIEPRLNQIFVPLLAIIDDPAAREEVRALARRYNRELVSDRGHETEAHVLEVIRDILASPEQRLSIKDITAWFSDRHGEDYERKVTSKWMGWVIRRKLRLRTERTRDGYIIRPEERSRIARLFERYGVSGDDPRDAEGTSQMA